MSKSETSGHEEEAEMADKKMKKSRCKAVFTRYRNRLHDLLEDEETSKEDLRSGLDKMEEAMDKFMDSIDAMVSFCKANNRTEEMKKSLVQVEEVNLLYDETMKLYHAFGISSEGSITEPIQEKSINTDMYKQLKRVAIPVFTGIKKDYEFWISAFKSCVDKTDASPEYKLLQLRQYLGGEAKSVIDGLGHSAEAYEAAKERLERKFGGKRRKVNRHLEEIEKFPVIRYENAKVIEKYADLLDVAIINMKEHDSEDLNSGFLYVQLLKKLPESMIHRFQRWLYEHEKQETIEHLKEWVLKESEFYTVAMETKYGLDNIKVEERRPRIYSKEQKSFFMKSKKAIICRICNGQHGAWECNMMKQLSVTDRWEKAKETGLCFRCLSDSHHGNNCKWTKKCGINGCTKVHHRLLHRSQLNPSASVYTPKQKFEQTEKTFTNVSPVYIALRTVPVLLCANGKELKVNALLDDGSTKTYINEDVAAELGITGKVESVRVTTLNGRAEEFQTMNVQFAIKSEDRNLELKMEASTTKQVTGNLRPIDWNECSSKWAHLRGLRFPSIGRRPKVDLLIGLDYAELHRSLGELIGEEGSPTARLTPLGWTCVGPVDFRRSEQDTTLMFAFHAGIEISEDVNDMLKRFWEVESVESEKQPLSINDQKVINMVNENTVYSQDDKRYEVPIPWNEKRSQLQNNREMAEKRLVSTERKLKTDPELQKEYAEIIRKYESKGYISKLANTNSDDNTTPKWYLPHFPVVRRQRSTTKVRMVFDASAKYEGLSLNDVVHPGPKLQNELIDILLRFRKQAVALICDIEEMYLQIGLFPPDRHFHSFLWREDSRCDPEEYVFNRVVFGVNASPFLAQYVSQENARRFQKDYPLAAESVIKSTYMDDTIDSVKNDQLAITLYHELCSLWKCAGMHPRKWMSNSEEVLRHIPQSERAFHLDIDKDELPCLKTLGMSWLSESDMFTYHHTEPEIDMKITKRMVLKTIASIFDPLGFIVPFTVRAKIILQKIWLTGLNWDDKLPDTLITEVKTCFSELKDLKQIVVPRCLNVVKDHSEIHTFVDASTDAYGAVAYHKVDKQIRIIASKGKVAPLKTYSIPRLELMAAVLGLALTAMICSALGIGMKCATFWTDSTNVLHWIHNQSRQFKPFVANRVGTIHQLSSPNQWRYVPTKENPADLASRGKSVMELTKSDLWWQGPEFLIFDRERWPDVKVNIDDATNIEMKRKSMTNTFVTLNNLDEDFRLDARKFSDWIHLVRISAWVNRFIDNCQVTKSERRMSQELNMQELEHVENSIIIAAQAEAFGKEYQTMTKGKLLSPNSKLAPLNPRLDSDGVMRSDSRLRFAEFISYNARFPILLPRKHPVTRLIVKHCHESTNHGGTNATLVEISKRYWVISAREEIRECESNCAKCKLLKAKGSKQIMGPLPEERVNESLRSFTNTAVDYAGPLITKQGRGKARLKRYLCVFTCMSTRAVHLEVSYSLDTNSFMNALSRFISRRGVPKTILSDNGTNFVGCVRELKELYGKLDQNKITKQCAVQKIEWKFIPPNAPHFGGVHESMVKTAKRALYKILGNADITDEELITAISRAEALINSRPLTYQSSNPNDDIVLTPNHFLTGQMGGHFAPEMSNWNPHDIRGRWRRVQELERHFWNRWLQEYIPTLGSRAKWQQKSRDFKVDDIVIIIDRDTPRGQWPLGKIVKVFTGSDGHVRVADVQRGDSVFRRPISRLSFVTESAK